MLDPTLRNFSDTWTEELLGNLGVCPGCNLSWEKHHINSVRLTRSFHQNSVDVCGIAYPINIVDLAQLLDGQLSGRDIVASLHASILNMGHSKLSKETPTPGVKERVMRYVEKPVCSRVERGALNYWDSWTYHP